MEDSGYTCCYPALCPNRYIQLTPMVFETLKLENPAIWLGKSIFALNHAHLKLHDQFVASFNRNAQNQLYTLISFWDIKGEGEGGGGKN